jgi:ketosteroid isomerase-like protein
MGRTCALAAGWLLVGALAAHGQVKPVPPEDPAHGELRALRDRLLDAFNRNDLDALLKDVHPNAVLTWQNGEVSRGHDGIRAYYARMMSGPNRIVESVRATADVDELTILYGDRTGLAFGNLGEDFRLTDGTDFHLDNRWTATVVKDGGRWVVAGLHVSANVFDNPIQRIAMRRVALWAGGAALVAGLLLGVVGTRLAGRRRGRQP